MDINITAEELGKKIRAYRVEHNITQDEMCKLCKISKPTLCGLELGKWEHKVTAKTKHRIFKALGVE